ncbi:hypothetical protein WA1_42185 [Scytonema hofmannii PCC 7110]|uniref:Resolvase HTH domain-containing protein n=1 Tax=Scytonema hofmannii PCC 7110 TaxID=128403 RepID=A0A139WV88_9CYAN|nr:hypothetical protein WA1_42185 [Scytonema hofmannii PCC 7110]
MFFSYLARYLKNHVVKSRFRKILKEGRRKKKEGRSLVFRWGRPKALNQAKRQLAVKLYTEGQHTIVEICKLMGYLSPA